MSRRGRQEWIVIQFPGSNCDNDTLKAIAQFPEISARFHWHTEKVKPGAHQVAIIPGGFSFGDYLRTGAIAKLSPAILSLPDAVEAGLHVLGLCNGFQILQEARLLPGILKVNAHLKFVSKVQECRIESEAFPWLKSSDVNRVLKFPIAHGFGNFQSSTLDFQELQPIIKYVDNPNGSARDIAGIYRKLGKGSLTGMMPHPERASYADLRLGDGCLLWKNAIEAFKT